MLDRIIDAALHNRLAVLILFAVAVVAGIIAMRHIHVDAFPDTTPVQVQINTSAPALGPEEIEQQITLPVELARLTGIEGQSRTGPLAAASAIATVPSIVLFAFMRRWFAEGLLAGAVK